MENKYDVFISFKNTAGEGGLTPDRMIAEQLHSTLVSEGLNVFFSEKDLSNAAYVELILDALNEADVLVVVGTSAEHVTSTWVRSEWNGFYGAIMKGRKKEDSIVTVLQGITSADLPIPLCGMPSFNANRIQDAVAHIFKALGKISNSEALEWYENKLRETEEDTRRAAQMRDEARKKIEEAQKSIENAVKQTEEARKSREQAEQSIMEERKKTEEALRVTAEQQKKREEAQNIISAELAKKEEAMRLSEEERQKREALKLETEAIREKERQKAAAAAERRRIAATKEIQYRKSVKRGVMVTKILISVIAVILGATAMGIFQHEDNPDWKYYSIDIQSVGIGKYTGKETDVNVPDRLDGKKVVEIGYQAFSENADVKSIVIPDSVTSIGDEAFSYCKNLTSVSSGIGVTRIGNEAFYECENLTFITIPDGVTSIGDWAFYKCENLTNITLPDSVNNMGEGVFSGCISLRSITIPDGVTSIGESAFESCLDLSSISIPNSVTSIGLWAFYECENLTGITIPDSLISIDHEAFRACSRLTRIIIPDSVISIGCNAFDECKNLTVYAPHPADYYNELGCGNYKKWVVK